jgi:N-acetylmuramoyl-L-alanine amidase
MSIKIVKIMLDPGHNYATYNQSPVVATYYEGRQMWRLYQFLRKALEARGIVVGCTKKRCDQDVSVTARGRMARGYDALISLHSNACSTESVDRPVGIHFYDDDCGVVDGESVELAKLLSRVVAEVMQTQQAQQYDRLSSRDRDGDGRKNDDYYGVLYGAHQEGVPAIILEHSFHTNTRAATWLLDDGNLQRLAEAEAEAIAEYFGVIAEPAQPTKNLYRVRKSWNDARSQIGAFVNLENAQKACPIGYVVYDAVGKPVYKPTGKTIDQLAREVLAGKWGNGSTRKQRLTAAGYDYKAIQRKVNELLRN